MYQVQVDKESKWRRYKNSSSSYYDPCNNVLRLIRVMVQLLVLYPWQQIHVSDDIAALLRRYHYYSHGGYPDDHSVAENYGV